jgi:hypothetical protein
MEVFMNNHTSVGWILLILVLFEGVSVAQWTQTGFPATYSPTDLARSGASLYAVTDSFGVFKSTNEGATWTSINSGLIGQGFAPSGF